MLDELARLRRAMNEAYAKGNLPRYARSLRKAAAMGDAVSMARLAVHYLGGLTTRSGRVVIVKSFARALRSFRAAAEPGRIAELMRLRDSIHDAHANGDLRSYARYLRDAAKLNEPDSMTTLAMHLLDDLKSKSGRMVILKDSRRAERLFRAAAKLGNTTAMLSLGAMVGNRDLARRRNGERLKLPTEALRWEQRAAALGDELAQFNLAMSSLNAGRPSESVRRFRARASRDNDALFEVAKAELWGRGTKQNVRAAMRKLEWLAKNGDDMDELTRGDVMVLLARTLSEGWLVPRDFGTAVRWLKRAVRETRCAEARGRLAELGVR